MFDIYKFFFFIIRCLNKIIELVRCNVGEYVAVGKIYCLECGKGFYCLNELLVSFLLCFNGIYINIVG